MAGGSSQRLRCASCGKATRARHADILQGWYTGPGGARYCSWSCVERAPKPKGRHRSYFAQIKLPGATRAADVDRWVEKVVAPALAKLAAQAGLGGRDGERRGPRKAGRGVVREFSITDYDEVLRLWKSTEGIVLRDADKRRVLSRYLTRNRGMSFVYEAGGEVAGAVLCGTDGRRGYLHHLAVAPRFRRKGVGRALVAAALQALAKAGIDKCHLMVLPANASARDFWKSVGWVERSDILLMSYTVQGNPMA